MFPSLIARAATVDVISNGMGGTRNGALQVVCFFSPLISASKYIWLKRTERIIIIVRCMLRFNCFRRSFPCVNRDFSGFASSTQKVCGL